MQELAQVTQSQIMRNYRNITKDKARDIIVKDCDLGINIPDNHKTILIEADYPVDNQSFNFNVIALVTNSGDNCNIVNMPFMYFTDEDNNEYRYNGKKNKINDLMHYLAERGAFNKSVGLIEA